jgi:uncharacterized protein
MDSSPEATYFREFVEHIVRELVDSPESVRVEVEHTASNFAVQINVAAGDIGKIIGKQGKTATALRTLLMAVAAKRKMKAQLVIVEG